MLHTKFSGNQSASSGVEKNERVFAHGDHLDYVASIMLLNLHFLVNKRCDTNILLKIGQ